jgi:hypothetical protein
VLGPVYLVVLVVFWISGLAEYFGAVDGITRHGTPIGNLLYAALCVAATVTAGSTPETAESAERLTQVHDRR